MKSLNVYDVKMLEKKEWKEMSPEYGHILFNMWKKDEETFADGVKEDREGIDLMFLTLSIAVSDLHFVTKYSNEKDIIGALKLFTSLYTLPKHFICVQEFTRKSVL